MQIIEIIPLSNGGHRNQSVDGKIQVPEGWAMIPEGMEIPATFPFVEIEVEGQTVTAMTAGAVPPPEPEPEPEPDDLAARVSTLEAETAAITSAIEKGLSL